MIGICASCGQNICPTGRRTSLGTTNRQEAQKIAQAKNDAIGKPALGFALAKAYLAAYDQSLLKRAWQDVMDEFCSRGQPQTRALRQRKLRALVYDAIRKKPLIETTSQGFHSNLAIWRRVHARIPALLAKPRPWAEMASLADSGVKALAGRAREGKARHYRAGAQSHPGF